ncbi:hypothetical protein SEA_DIANE_72 [Streptomyces phage Diane]|uniref:Uncharacterized protein n=1 Tax=Streptomyces phage Diane TaxID=2041207 RepID=A0A291LHI8_9CAUD|nr:hypothetical protein KGG78_gp72 [Streptomyces phage Diane]ATI18856.1 hypothetical protein SEA_DIANE_72 [Streptomyces phage Diane]
MRAWTHTHLPRLRADVHDVISVKVPGQPIEYASAVLLSDVEFRVHERGRQRAVRQSVRNVHAWVIGEVEEVRKDPVALFIGSDYRQAVYDPWKGSTFVDRKTLAPVRRAHSVIYVGKDVFYQ